MIQPPISEMWFLQLPIRNKDHYGDWLNIIWDNQLSINVLGTDPYVRIDSEDGEGYRILKTGVVENVKLKGVGATLIACPTDNLLYNIAQVEEDFNLPHGINRRRNELYKSSYYWSEDDNPNNVDQHIKYAKIEGFRAFIIYYPAFLEGRCYKNLGDYRFRNSDYQNGIDDLKEMLNKIKNARMIPGFHFLHSHIGKDSKYITPIPDYRLNLLRIFTLAGPLAKYDTTIYVAQNPTNSSTADNLRVLKIRTGLISYKNYSTSQPYKFNGCVRGIDETTVNSQPTGYMFGLLRK